jgi:hypothetical protein
MEETRQHCWQSKSIPCNDLLDNMTLCPKPQVEAKIVSGITSHISIYNTFANDRGYSIGVDRNFYLNRVIQSIQSVTILTVMIRRYERGKGSGCYSTRL